MKEHKETLYNFYEDEGIVIPGWNLNEVNYYEYKFEDIKFDQVKIKQDIYKPKDKLDEYIIKGATYSTKFVPLMNDGSDGSDYTELMGKDAKRLLVDKGFNFINSNTNNQIQKIPFFAQTTFNISGGTESDTSFSVNSLMKLGELILVMEYS